jgi:hypothetical protein
MSNEAKYLQFPLCALAYGSEPKNRLERVICYGVVEAGHVIAHRLKPELRQSFADEYATRLSLSYQYKQTDKDNVAALLGGREIGITFTSVQYMVQVWNELLAFKQPYESTHGRDVDVRVEESLVFETRDNHGMSYREFSVLCAIYSCIGAKKYPVRITRDKIQCRQLGYKSPAIMQAELPNRKDGAQPLTLRQINLTVDKLHERGFFARARANERQTFYSHRLTQEQIEQALMEGKSYSKKFHQRRQQRDAALMEQIKQAKTTIKADGLLK